MMTWNPQAVSTPSGQISSRPKTRVLGHPNGGQKYGNRTPYIFQKKHLGYSRLVKSYSIWPDTMADHVGDCCVVWRFSFSRWPSGGNCWATLISPTIPRGGSTTVRPTEGDGFPGGKRLKLTFFFFSMNVPTSLEVGE